MKVLALQTIGPRKGARRAPSAQYWFERGIAACEGEPALAQYCFERAVAQRFDFGLAHLALGKLALAQASEPAALGQAIGHLHLAVLSSNDQTSYASEARQLLAIAWAHSGQRSAAIALLTEGLATATDPDDVCAIHMQLGSLFELLAADDVEAGRKAVAHFAAARGR